jgi:DNA uptake protein ComE-like DNA-binding protein
MNRLMNPGVFIAAALLGALAGCKASGDGARGADSAAATDTATGSAVAPAATPPAGTPAAEGAGAATARGAMLDPNAATADELRAVPGLTPALADALVAGRPYADMRAVDRVLARQLSEQQRDTVYTRLWKPIDLNTATAEEILLIPGVGPRMRHEFEEYRPYRSIEQFRREIGKYVSRDEVARLERYVTIR